MSIVHHRRTMYLFLAIGVICLSACQPVKLRSAEWQTFTSTKGNFTISMPGMPKEESETQDGGLAGQIGLAMFVFEDIDRAFGVMYSDFPADLISLIDLEVMLDSTLNRMPSYAAKVFSNKKAGNLTSKKSISYENRFPGRHFRLESSDGSLIITGRLYVMNARLYMLFIGMNYTSFSEADTNKFLDSFKLIK
jgi:hypothetical protein